MERREEIDPGSTYCVELHSGSGFAWIFEDRGIEVVGSLCVSLTWSPFIAYLNGHFNTALAIFTQRITGQLYIF